MRILPLVVALSLAGCAGLSTYQARTSEDVIKIVKQAGGTGCYYYRYGGNTRPYADVEGVSIVVTTLGKGTSYLDCLQAIPADQKALLFTGSRP